MYCQINGALALLGLHGQRQSIPRQVTDLSYTIKLCSSSNNVFGLKVYLTVGGICSDNSDYQCLNST